MKSIIKFILFAFLATPVFSKPPNIVFIFTDDQGWGDLGAYGNPKVRTPNIDALAAEGALFTQFYVASPVCSPSRAALLSGRFPAETGIHYAIGGPAGSQYNDAPWLDSGLPNVYRTFAEAGYRTGHYGKWHIGHKDKEGKANAPAPSDYGVQESAASHSSGPGLPRMNNANKAEVIADAAIGFIERNKDNPFFLSIWHMDPHAVLDPTFEQMEPYLEHTHPSVRDHLKSSETVYYAILENIDRAVGRVVKKIEELGLRENTIIIFSSDNGPSPLWSQGTGHAGAGSAGPFRGTKGSLYEGGIRVPFIVSWPAKIPFGHVDDKSVVGAVDVYPTLASLAGLKAGMAESLDGEDRSNVLLGKPEPRINPLMWEYRFGNWGREIQVSPQLAIRDGDWKLLINPDGSRTELYNLKEDINETENRARYEIQTVENLRSRLMDWWNNEVPGEKKAPPYAGHWQWNMPKGN